MNRKRESHGKQVAKQIFVHDVLESYRNFFDNEWSTKVLSVAESAQQLQELLYDLILEWRGAVYTTALPHELLESVRNFHDSFVKSNTPNTDLLRLSEGIKTRFTKEIDEFRLDISLTRKIQEKIVQIGAEIIELHKNAPIKFPIEQGCWTNDKLNMFRAVRNSLSHAGGRVTEELLNYKHDFELADDRIQVTPDKTKALYKLLKNSVLSLSEKAASMQQFNT